LTFEINDRHGFTTAQAYLRVPLGVALGVLFFGETLTSTAWIVVGVAAMTIPARK
jgi:EamA domain-containing membrane protein RarD